MLNQQSAHDTRKCNHRTHAQIDATANDDQRHPQCPDGHDHGLGEDDFEIGITQEKFPHFAIDGEKTHDEQQSKKWSKFGKKILHV